jgi:hypothetical protein
MSTTPLTETHIKGLLAYRIDRHSKKVDKIREDVGAAFSAPAILQHGQRLSEHLAAIEELQEVWERLFGEIPSAFDVAVAAAEHRAAQEA